MLSKFTSPPRDSVVTEMDELEKRLLEKSIRKRDLLVRSIQRLCVNIENMDIDENDPKSALEAAKIDKADLEKKLSDFNEIQSTIEMDVEDDQLEEHENERTRVETIARSAKIVLADFIAEHSEVPVNINTTMRRSLSAETKTDRKMKRPEIVIPKFEGDYKKWNDFKNVFESLVVNDATFNKVEKMVYLKQAMQKTAADVISKFEITDSNFDKAWEKLKKRYENRRAIINNHLLSLTQLPLAKAESGLQKLLDTATDAIESLDAMGVKDGWSYMVSFLVTEKLDPETRKAWEIETVKEAEYPKYERLESFLQQRVRVIESMGLSSVKPTNVTSSKKTFNIRKPTEVPASGEKRCFCCQENHDIAECEKFIAKTLIEKTELIKRKGLCFQCLCKGHMVLSCRAPRCSKCGKRHHISLHVNNEESAVGVGKNAESSTTEAKKSLCTIAKGSETVLPSALVWVSQGERKIVVRTFLDSCSEVNLISEYLVKKLKFCSKRSNVVLETAMPGSLNLSKFCKLRIESRSRDFYLETDFQIAPNIAKSFTVYDARKYKSRNIDLADDPLIGGSRVDLLIGAEFYEAVMLSGRLKLVDEPFLRETMFGWVAIGVAMVRESSESSKCFLTIQEQLQQYFELEGVESQSIRESWTSEERKCDDLFEADHRRLVDGFEVALPRGLPIEFLGESRSIAFKQFCAIERRLSCDDFVEYKAFMEEYIRLGHMTLVEKPDSSEFRCFLPHHPVWKRSSTTTRCRGVFNASCSTSSGYSLNDILMKGPVLQEDLLSIVVRFRCKKVAFTADIEKMYRQVLVRKEDRRLQCVLWRDSPNEPIRTYELNTVTYGTKPASYLATKCLSKIADEYDSECTETAAIVRGDFYMDDVLTGDSSVERARERLQELRQCLSSAGFRLRKFSSSDPLVLVDLPDELIEGASEIGHDELVVGVLGLRWITAEDRFVFYARLPEQPISWTKREILAEVSRIFDPLGLLSPVTITFKIILQSLWANKLGWDEKIESEIVDRYLSMRAKLVDLSSVLIPRFVGEVEYSEFHIFCDASEKAYGAAVYMRCQVENGIQLRLLCAKTRVAPVKRISLPRLELCGAVLAAKVFSKVKVALRLKEDARIVAWTDSTIVLSWLAKPEHSWCPFVANRVTRVTEVLPGSVWSHVNSEDNAADVISRGLEKGHLDELERFISGPKFLQQQSISVCGVNFDNRALSEEKRKARTCMATTESWINQFFESFSSYSKYIRIVAYVTRFSNNSALEKLSRTFGNLTIEECKIARIVVVKLAQKLINVKKLEKIDFFEDADGLFRLQSRLSNAELSERVKYPILLPKCKFLILLIEHYHVKFFHAECLFLRNFICREYFVIGSLSRIIRSVVYKCTTCRRFIPNLEYRIPVGQLPAARVTASPAFVEVGVDFAGPFLTRAVGPSGNRGKVLFKSYVSVFVCMVTRACHLEVVEDLSTKCFLDAFSRFVARRGVCANVYSDHGTNFVGADRELRAAFEMIANARSDIENHAVRNGFCWHFIPPRAPNFGGLWEAAVKSFKVHFRKVVGSQILSFVELFTLVTQIEAVLNSRPICASDSIGVCFITPSHLCIGRSLVILPELSGDVMSGSHLVRYKMLRGMLERFWSVWHNDYLISLRKSVLSLKSNRIPIVGELVMLKDEPSAPSNWSIARITKLFLGKDGVARVADVQFGSKVLRRPVCKLIPLLAETNESQGGGGC